jgi:hypothetical protein
MLLLKNQKMFLHITGYSSSEGSEEYNLGLSARRAKAVQNFFKGRGIKKSRLILDYFGEEAPLNNNQNEDEKAENRRVEFSLEYHIFDIDEASSLRLDYKNLLKENGLDYSFLYTKKPVIKKKEYYFEKKKESTTNILDKKNEVVETIPTVEETVEDIADVIDALNNFDLPVEEEVVEEKVIEASNSSEKYILVIAVLSSKQNADSYIKKNPSANYEFSEGRYYIYEDSNSSKEELKKVKISYTKDSWIKKIR